MGGENQNSGKSNKRKKRHAKYLQHGGKKSTISAGVKGFLITCVGGKERQSIKEAISLLDQFYEKPEVPTTSEKAAVPAKPSTVTAVAGELKDSEEKPSESKAEAAVPPPEADAAAEAEGDDEVGDGDDDDETPSDEESEDDAGETLGWVKSRRLDESGKAQGSAGAADSHKPGKDAGVVTKTNSKETTKSFDELLAEELDELRDKKKARFVGYETGCHGVIFVRMHSKKGVVDAKGPMELAEAIVRDAAATKQSKTRHCMRLLPIDVTCYASTAEMLKVAEPLIKRHFPVDQPSIKFAVVCEARANTNLKKMDFINAIAKLVPEPHCVDLKNPQKTILVQVVKTACAVGVVQDFKELSKYNLRQLTSPEGKTSGKLLMGTA